ncbi:hypothetical protein VU10_04330 [Desulfobulbus sp. US1]|nr:hypothetical protein [Desulfobulbus sp. US4]MCW5207764.1 hypothetical protein [Desulfobulbus sp. US2]MCW5209409.1 hypothetical protein [Desulfobulbus sp. US1]MCW5210797.1 hypothetical protein [Desulfobulbus sp. N3]
MLLIDKKIYFWLLLAVLASPALINQARAISIEIPVKATNPLIEPAVSETLASPQLAAMRELVVKPTVVGQSSLNYDEAGAPILHTVDETTGELKSVLPMQDVLEPLMQETIMAQMMESLSSTDNPDGAVFLFAPSFVKDIYFPPAQ